MQASNFGKLFSLPVDGQIAVQPLYEQNVTIQGKGVHNVVFMETQHNSVYAFDADTPAVPLWTVNLGPSVSTSDYNWAGDGPYEDITPEIGILGTPVIDPSTGTLYVVAATIENSVYYYRLHALDISERRRALRWTVGNRCQRVRTASAHPAPRPAAPEWGCIRNIRISR